MKLSFIYFLNQGARQYVFYTQKGIPLNWCFVVGSSLKGRFRIYYVTHLTRGRNKNISSVHWTNWVVADFTCFVFAFAFKGDNQQPDVKLNYRGEMEKQEIFHYWALEAVNVVFESKIVKNDHTGNGQWHIVTWLLLQTVRNCLKLTVFYFLAMLL